MQNRSDICDGQGNLLAYTITDAWPEGLCAYSDEADYIQTLTWNYNEGKHLAAHQHLNVPREAAFTQEAVVMVRGRMRTTVFDEQRNLVAEVELRQGDAMVLLRGGHGYDILEDGTRVLEIKNGPYPGADADRVRIE